MTPMTNRLVFLAIVVMVFVAVGIVGVAVYEAFFYHPDCNPSSSRFAGFDGVRPHVPVGADL